MREFDARWPREGKFRTVRGSHAGSLAEVFRLCPCALQPCRLCEAAWIGVAGKYNDALTELGKTPRGGNVKRAIAALEYVVRRDPLYKDSLTQLGRAYYYADLYSAAFDVLKRALAVNKDDEIGWIVLGLTQFKLGQDERGLESFKGGLTLLAKSTREGYRDIEDDYWDLRGVVQRSLRRSIASARKGVGEKRRIVLAGEVLLHRIDREVYDAEEHRVQDSDRINRN